MGMNAAASHVIASDRATQAWGKLARAQHRPARASAVSQAFEITAEPIDTVTLLVFGFDYHSYSVFFVQWHHLA